MSDVPLEPPGSDAFLECLAETPGMFFLFSSIDLRKRDPLSKMCFSTNMRMTASRAE